MVDVPEIAHRLADRFWPGPLTLIMRRNPKVPSNVSAGLPTVAVRMPSHRIPLDLIRASGVPIAAPSANIFMRPSSTTAEHVVDDFSGDVDVILNGGPSYIGVESTVVDLTQDPPVLLRPGGTPLEALRELVPDIRLGTKYIDLKTGAPSSSPGMLTKHYSPTAELYLFRGAVHSVHTKMLEDVELFSREGKTVGVMIPSEDEPVFQGKEVEMVLLGSGDDMESIAQNLFAGMRALDHKGCDVILVRAVDSGGLGLAILDRLIRASEGKVIDVDHS